MPSCSILFEMRRLSVPRLYPVKSNARVTFRCSRTSSTSLSTSVPLPTSMSVSSTLIGLHSFVHVVVLHDTTQNDDAVVQVHEVAPQPAGGEVAVGCLGAIGHSPAERGAVFEGAQR